jgi:DNA-binding FadR family transcriptional regulator
MARGPDERHVLVDDPTTEAAGRNQAFRPQRVQRPREQVELQIRRAILSGQFARGERLPSEADLAKELGVGRSTVREALRALAAAGLVSTTRGATGGTFVEAFDHRSLATSFGESVTNVMQLGSLSYREVADVRAMLEIPSASLAARNRREEHLQKLDQIVERERSVDVSDREVPDLNASFHETVAEASGNRLLAALVSALHSATHPLAFIDTSPDLGRQSVIDHLRLVQAIQSQDEHGAADHMRDHLAYLGAHARERHAE